jgi:trigger factor
MDYEIVESDGNRRTVRFQEPSERVDRLFRQVRGRITRDLDLPGFRPGKVPRSVVDKRFGNLIKAEVAEVVRQDLTSILLTEEDWILDDQSPVSDEELPVEGEDYTFSITYSLFDGLELEGYKNLELVEPVFDLDREVEQTLQSLRERLVSFEPVQRKAETGDLVVLETPDRETEGNKNLAVRIGNSQMGPGFDDIVEGRTAGDAFSARMESSEEGQTELGEPIRFVLTEVREPKLPDLDDEFAKKVGRSDSMQDMRQELREDLEKRLEQEKKQFLERQALDKILEKNQFDPPQYMVDNMTEDLLRRLDQDELDERTVEAARKMASRKVREFFVLRQVAIQEDVEVSNQEVEEERSPEESASSVYDRLRNGRAMELILSTAVLSKESGTKTQSPPDEEPPSWSWQEISGDFEEDAEGGKEEGD